MILISLTSCWDDPKYPNIFSDKAVLRVFKSETKSETKSEGWFVVAVGQISNNQKTVKSVHFYAQNIEGKFVYFETEPKNIDYIINDTVKVPTVKFETENFTAHKLKSISALQNELIGSCSDVDITITCNKKQLPEDLNFQIQ